MDAKVQLDADGLQRAYHAHQSDLWLRRLKVIYFLLLGSIPNGLLLDYFVYREQASLFLMIRIVTILAIGSGLGLLYTRLAKDRGYWLSMFWVFVAVAHISLMIFFSEGITSPYYIAIVLVIMTACLLLPWTFRECLWACSLTLAIYTGACGFHWLMNGAPQQENWVGLAINNSFFVLLFSVICVTSSYVAEGFRFREFKLRFDLDRNKKELEGSYKKLAELDKAKSQFFANISHELRTPLTLIISPIDQLRNNLPAGATEKFQETLDLMYENGLRLFGLINDLLDLVKLEDHKLALKLAPVNLSELLPGLAASMRGVTERAKLKLEVLIKESTPLIVPADKDRLEKIFLNLLFNAVKFTPQGGAIRLVAYPESEQVVVEVQDTGIGIAEENLPSVFSRFWQEDGSSTRARQGTGIGLALVKELVELHQGAISVQSIKGEGTTFQVRLPLKADAAEAEPAEESPDHWMEDLTRVAQQHREELMAAPAARRESAPQDRYKHSLLLVEDEVSMQRFLVMELSDTYNVVVASDGQEGFELAHRHQPKLILTDMMLPKLDGITLCRKLKSSPNLRPAKIVLLTARADDRTKITALEAGADDFLTKPFSTVELRTRLSNLLLTAQLERELHSQNQVLETTLKQLRATEAQLIQTERLSALGNLSAGIMHEINNPVNYMLTAVHFLRGAVPAPSADATEAIDDIESGLKRVRDIIADLKSFAYGGSSTAKQECDPSKILRTAKQLLAHELTPEIQLEEVVDAESQLYANENQLVQLLVNFLQNALYATAVNPSRNKPRRIKVHLAPAGAHFQLSVWDNGTGIAKENFSKVFDPFFTTKPVGDGMGLGLSICHTIVKQHQGEISMASELGEYTELTVKLPVSQPEPDEEEEGALETEPKNPASGLL